MTHATPAVRLTHDLPAPPASKMSLPRPVKPLCPQSGSPNFVGASEIQLSVGRLARPWARRPLAALRLRLGQDTFELGDTGGGSEVGRSLPRPSTSHGSQDKLPSLPGRHTGGDSGVAQAALGAPTRRSKLETVTSSASRGRRLGSRALSPFSGRASTGIMSSVHRAIVWLSFQLSLG